jgi:periplasmic protein CpxP/Spy
MKKLIIAAFLFVGIASFAQEADQTVQPQRERLTPEQRNDRQLKKLTSELNLDANQQTQIKQLLADRSANAEKFREDRKNRKDNGTKLTTEQKAAFKQQMADEKTANDAKMKSILNADQYKKWTSIQDEKREKAKEKMKDRKDNN